MRCEIATTVRNIIVQRVCPNYSGSFIAVLQHNPGLLFEPLAKIGTFYFLMSHLGFTPISQVSPTLFFFAVKSSPRPRDLAFPAQRWGGTLFSSLRLCSLINSEGTANE